MQADYNLIESIAIPASTLDDWQTTTDLMASIAGVHAVIVTRVHKSEFEILVSSQPAGADFGAGVHKQVADCAYCETVVNSGEALAVTHADGTYSGGDKDNPCNSLQSYFGLPLYWPGGELFGTFSLQDIKPNGFDDHVRQLANRLRDSIERSLGRLILHRIRHDTESAVNSEDKYRALVETLPATTYTTLIGESTRAIYVSPQIEQLVGYSQQELYDNADLWANCIHPDDFERTMAEYNAAVINKAEFFLEYRVIHKNGDIRWVSDQGRVFDDESDKPVYLHGILFNITDKKQTELALQENRERLAQAQRIARVGDWELDIASGNAQWSDELHHIVGTQTDQVVGPAFLKTIVHPDDWDAVEISMHNAIEKGITHEAEYRITTADDHEVWLYCRADRTLDESGKPQKLVGIAQDITKRKQAELAQSRYQKRLELAGKAAVDLIYEWEVDSDKLKTFVDADALLGYPQGTDCMGNIQNWLAMIHEDDRHVLDDAVEKHRNHTGDIQYEYRIRRADGSYRYWSDHALPQIGRNGKPIRWVGVCTDITDQKEAERALKSSEERFALAMRGSNEGLFDWNVQTNEVYFSPRWKSMLGYEDHELENQFSTWESLTETSDKEETMADMNAFLSGETNRFEREFRMRHKDGHWVNILSRAYMMRDKKGEPLRVVGTHLDITESKAARQQIERERNRAQNYLDVAGVMLLALNTEGKIELVNPKACEILGLPEDQLIGMSWIDNFILPEQREKIRPFMDSFMRGEIEPAKTHENPIIDANGKVHQITWQNAPLRDSEGRIKGVLSSGQDITERVEAEELLHLMKYGLDHVDEAAYLVDEHACIQYVNEGALRQLGYSEDELLTMTVQDIDPTGRANDWSQEWQHFRDASSTTFETMHRKKDGTTFPVEINANYIDYQDESFLLGFVRDITEKKAVERALVDKEMAQAAARAKSTFLANMSHEIRTPLNGILGLARMGEREDLQEKMHELFAQITDSGQHLLYIVNDILDLSKLEAGKLVVEDLPFQLMDEINDVIRLVSKQYEGKNLELHVVMPDIFPEWVSGDPHRLKQILANLLSNAFKFTEEGAITVTIRRLRDMMEFRIEDTGIGMTHEQLEHLFTPFDQADKSTTRRYGGTGLGMAICNTLVNLMEGNLVVQSLPGFGTTCTLSLPYPEACPLEQHPQDDEPGTGRLRSVRVLAAEDVEINRIVLEDIVVTEGATITSVENGQQAIDQIKQKGSDAFDIVLMDVQMPVVDGYEATREIHRLAPGLPVIGLTAYALEEERERSLESGMLEHIAKPVEPELLVQAIRKHLA